MYAELRRQIPIHFRNSVEYPEMLYVMLVHPEDWRETYPIGLMSQHGDRWHSVDEEGDRHIESSLMLDVAYSLLARRIREEDEVPDWISENYPLVDYSSVFENSSRQGTKIEVHIADHDFDGLVTMYSQWNGMPGRQGRFEKMVNGKAVNGHPSAAHKHAYWLSDAYADTILAGAFLDAQGAPYELWWDMGEANEAMYLILTDWASEHRRNQDRTRSDDVGAVANGAAEELVAKLSALRENAGAPSLREIANMTGGDISHTTVADVFNGRRVPSWTVIAAIVLSLGGSEKEFRKAWFDAQSKPNDNS